MPPAAFPSRALGSSPACLRCAGGGLTPLRPGAGTLAQVFYLKMKGDYHRYLAEFKTGADRKEAAESTLLAYKAAQVPCPARTPTGGPRSCSSRP